jgi:hypothetical protein
LPFLKKGKKRRRSRIFDLPSSGKEFISKQIVGAGSKPACLFEDFKRAGWEPALDHSIIDE